MTRSSVISPYPQLFEVKCKTTPLKMYKIHGLFYMNFKTLKKSLFNGALGLGSQELPHVLYLPTSGMDPNERRNIKEQNTKQNCCGFYLHFMQVKSAVDYSIRHVTFYKSHPHNVEFPPTEISVVNFHCGLVYRSEICGESTSKATCNTYRFEAKKMSPCVNLP